MRSDRGSDPGSIRIQGQFSHSYIICYPHTLARPLRLEFAGALYHITSRGDRRDAIYRAADEREAWVEVLGNVWIRGQIRGQDACFIIQKAKIFEGIYEADGHCQFNWLLRNWSA